MSGTKVRRLLIVSSRSRSKLAIAASVLDSVIRLEYDYETSTLSDLVSDLATRALDPGLPDGLLSNQTPSFGKFFGL
jgi:hypothetical protein